MFENITLAKIPEILPLLSPAEQEKLLLELDHLETLKNREIGQKKFLSFVREMWPSFIGGRHHEKMAKKLYRHHTLRN